MMAWCEEPGREGRTARGGWEKRSMASEQRPCLSWPDAPGLASAGQWLEKEGGAEGPCLGDRSAGLWFSRELHTRASEGFTTRVTKVPTPSKSHELRSGHRGLGGGWKWGEVAQTMYSHVSKHKKDKITKNWGDKKGTKEKKSGCRAWGRGTLATGHQPGTAVLCGGGQ
jgi:hypothetical protein